MLLRVFPMRSCSNGVFKRSGQIGRPCLLGYIDKCSAPCVGNISAEDHRDDRRRLLRLHGRPDTNTFIRRIEREMYAASEALDFEKAARLRDDLGAIQKALEKQAVVLGDGTDADVIALAEDPLEVAVQIFYVRGGRIRGQRGWVADRVEEGGTAELVEDFLLQLYAGAEDADVIPREILVPDAAARRRRRSRQLLSDLRGEPGADPGAAARRQEDPPGDRRPQRRAGAGAAQDQARPATSPPATGRSRRSRQALGLDEVPLRIECYDISNLQGTEVVASMVVFEDGLARKSEYRRFVIKGRRRAERRRLDARGDHPAVPAAARRAGPVHARSPTESGPMLVDPETGRPRKFAYAPGLVVVDGGPPQVAAAQRALDELGIVDIPVCGLAKRLEEVWLPDQEDPVILAPLVARGSTCCSGSATRRTGSRSPTTAPAGPSRWSRACSTTSRASARCAARPCSSTSAR